LSQVVASLLEKHSPMLFCCFALFEITGGLWLNLHADM